MKAITAERARALEIIKEKGPIKPAAFAMIYFKDHPGHNNEVDSGYGHKRKGGGMNICAGGFLAKIENACLLERVTSGGEFVGFVLSPDGRRALRSFRKLDKFRKADAKAPK